MRQFPRKVQKCNFSRTVFANEKTHLGPTLNTRKVGAWRAALKNFHSLLFSAQRLVHVCWCTLGALSDPCNRNHKSLAIGNHNFEVASFSRRTLTLQSLLFFDFLAFFVFRFSLLFLCDFPSFSKDFRGSAKRETLAFWGEKPLLFPKKQGLEGQGNRRKIAMSQSQKSHWAKKKIAAIRNRTLVVAAISGGFS